MAKSNDLNVLVMGDKEQGPDYLPKGFPLGKGDTIECDVCLECGQVQGKFPAAMLEIEAGEPT